MSKTLEFIENEIKEAEIMIARFRSQEAYESSKKYEFLKFRLEALKVIYLAEHT